MKKTLGKKLEEALLNSGMTQSDLARKLFPENKPKYDARGYQITKGRDVVSSWCRDKATPSPANMRKLFDALPDLKEKPAHDDFVQGKKVWVVEMEQPYDDLTYVVFDSAKDVGEYLAGIEGVPGYEVFGVNVRWIRPASQYLKNIRGE